MAQEIEFQISRLISSQDYEAEMWKKKHNSNVLFNMRWTLYAIHNTQQDKNQNFILNVFKNENNQIRIEVQNTPNLQGKTDHFVHKSDNIRYGPFLV